MGSDNGFFVVCSWCGEVVNIPVEYDDFRGFKFSHKICPGCDDKLMEEENNNEN